MAKRRTTVVLTDEDLQALRKASQIEGLSQSQLIRKGIRAVTSPYRGKIRPLVGWLKLTPEERKEILSEKSGDFDS